MAPPLPNSAHGDQLISAKRRGIPGETAPEPDTVSHIKSVRRRWTASEKVRIVAEKGKVVFRHACLMGAGGYRVQAARIEVSFRPVAVLVQVQEPGGARCEA